MIAIGSDHGGFELKGHIIEHLKEKGIELKDFGTYSEASVDYPDCAKPVCKAVLDGECECGILICGTGIGISMAANKFKPDIPIRVVTASCCLLHPSFG